MNNYFPLHFFNFALKDVNESSFLKSRGLLNPQDLNCLLTLTRLNASRCVLAYAIKKIRRHSLNSFLLALSNSSPPVRTSNSTSLTSDKPKGFNMR